MARQTIDTGEFLGDRNSDDLRVSFTKVNENFEELYLGGFHPQTPAELSAGVTPTNYQYPELNVLRYGTNATPGTTDMAAAVQAAISVAVAKGGGTVVVPAGTYLIGTTLVITGAVNAIHIRGEGAEATTLLSGITGAAAEPLIKNTASGVHFTLEAMELLGNNLTGASGNGHGLACINPGVTLAPQVVSLRDVRIRFFRGTGKNQSGASIPACGVFAYKSTGHTAFNATITGCAMGVRYREMDDSSFHGCLLDAHDNNGYYFDTSHAISIHGGTNQSSGSGGATDGCMYLEHCEDVVADGGEMKNGYPYLLNASGTNIYNHNIALRDMYLGQLNDARGHTAIRVHNGVANLVVNNCFFIFVNTMTDAKGVEVIQAMSGGTMVGLRIAGNSFRIGDGGTIAACVHLNVTTNVIAAPVIESNMFGHFTAAGSGTSITDAILLEGHVRSGVIRNNTFLTTTNLTITDAIHIGSVNVLALKIENNEYHSVSGTITNQVNNAAAVAFSRFDRVYVVRGVGTGTINSGATSATVTHGLSTTPQRAHISITLGENPTNTPGAVWIDTITSTQFNVNCENDPGASNLDFSWRAEFAQPFAFP